MASVNPWEWVKAKGATVEIHTVGLVIMCVRKTQEKRYLTKTKTFQSSTVFCTLFILEIFATVYSVLYWINVKCFKIMEHMFSEHAAHASVWVCSLRCWGLCFTSLPTSSVCHFSPCLYLPAHCPPPGAASTLASHPCRGIHSLLTSFHSPFVFLLQSNPGSHLPWVGHCFNAAQSAGSASEKTASWCHFGFQR